MIEKVVVTMNYIKAFIQSESSGGIMLLLAAILGVITANSPIAEQYFSLMHIYLGAENDDDPAMFLGQPVYANLYTDSTKDMYSTKNIPWYFTGMTTMINLHIHNHNTMALKILWAIWDIVLIVGIVTGIIMTIKKKFGRASATESKVSAEIKHVWRTPICCGTLVLLGFIMPLWSNPVTNTIAGICLTIPLVVFFISLIRGFNH